MTRGVPKFKCPECGHTVEATRENIITPLSTKKIKVLMCPNIQVGRGGVIYQHIVKIKIGRKWMDPEIFFHMPGRDGLYPVRGKSRDEVTFYLLRNGLWREGGPYIDGAYLNPVTDVKILWKDGVAVGYYSEFNHLDVPVMAELYVRPKYRGKGYGTEMVEDFLNSHAGPVGFYFIHEKVMRNLLLKVGVIQKTATGEYVFNRKIALLSHQANPIPFWRD